MLRFSTAKGEVCILSRVLNKRTSVGGLFARGTRAPHTVCASCSSTMPPAFVFTVWDTCSSSLSYFAPLQCAHPQQRRSILTGEPDKVTLQMDAPRALTSGDVMFAVGKLSRAAGFDPVVGKISVGKDPSTAVFDMSAKAAEDLVQFSKEQNLESITFSMCTELPVLQAVAGMVSGLWFVFLLLRVEISVLVDP